MMETRSFKIISLFVMLTMLLGFFPASVSAVLASAPAQELEPPWPDDDVPYVLPEQTQKPPLPAPPTQESATFPGATTDVAVPAVAAVAGYVSAVPNHIAAAVELLHEDFETWPPPGWDLWWEVDDVIVTIGKAADLSNSVKLAPPAVLVGDSFQYTIVISNTGIPLVSPIMTDVIPLGTEYISGTLACSSGNCWYDAVDNAVYWSEVGELQPGFVRYAHESGTADPFPSLWDIDYPVPHPVLANYTLSALNPGWPASLDDRDGCGYDAATKTFFCPDYNGDGGGNADDNIIEVDFAGTILNAWETDGGGNDSYDGSAIGTIFDIAVVPGSPTRYFATSAGDNLLHEIDLIKTGVWWTANTWGTINTCGIPGSSNIVGVDYDVENGVLYISDYNNTNIYVTDFDCNLLHTFTCTDGANIFNTGVTYIEGSPEANGEVWTTDYTTVQTRRCDTTGVVLEVFPASWAASPLGLVHVPARGEVSDLITVTFGVTCTNPGTVINEAIITDPALPAPVVLTAVTEQWPPPEWHKFINGIEWYPGITVTVQTSDTIEVVETISTMADFAQIEYWKPDHLELVDWIIDPPGVGTVDIGLDYFIWESPPGSPPATLTKTFHVRPCTWTETLLWEELWHGGIEWEHRPVEIFKLAPDLWINSDYEPDVLAGQPADFTLNYGNLGGYENDVWIYNTFPIESPFVGSIPAPTNVGPAGLWAKWDVGDLAMDDFGSITVTVDITSTLPPSTTIEIWDWIYNHIGDEAGVISTTFHVISPCIPVTAVDLSLMTSGDIYTGTIVEFSADITPDDFTANYTYTIDYDDGTLLVPTSSSDDPLTSLDHTFAAAGTYTVEIAVWNCDMTEAQAVTDTVQVMVIAYATPIYYIYLPIIRR